MKRRTSALSGKPGARWSITVMKSTRVLNRKDQRATAIAPVILSHKGDNTLLLWQQTINDVDFVSKWVLLGYIFILLLYSLFILNTTRISTLHTRMYKLLLFSISSTIYDECTAHVQKYGKTLSGQLSFPLFVIVKHAIL